MSERLTSSKRDSAVEASAEIPWPMLPLRPWLVLGAGVVSEELIYVGFLVVSATCEECTVYALLSDLFSVEREV